MQISYFDQIYERSLFNITYALEHVTTHTLRWLQNGTATSINNLRAFALLCSILKFCGDGS